MRRAASLGVAIMVAAASTLLILVGPAVAAPSSDEIISSLDVAASTVTAAAVVGDPQAVVALSAPISGFPTSGSNYLVISTGDAAALPGTPETFVSTDLPEAAAGADGNDLTQVKLMLAPPTSATCVAFDFAFLSEEFPEYVNRGFNDIFTAELNESLFSLEGNQVVTPNNFAYDSQGNAVSVDTIFGMAEPTGTVMDGSTPKLRATSPVKRKSDGAMDLFLSVQDLGDSSYDSAVIIDNLRWLSLSGPNCTEGASVIPSTTVTSPVATVPPSTTVPPGAAVPPGATALPGATNFPTRTIPPVGTTPPVRNTPPAGTGPPTRTTPPTTTTSPVPGGENRGDGNSGGGPRNASGGPGERAYLATQVPSLAGVFGDPTQLLLSALLAVLLVLFIAFPAEFFNRTFEENHEKISSWFRWVPRPSRLKLSSWIQFIIFALVTTVLLMAILPGARFSQAALAQMVGFLVVVPLVVVLLEVPGEFYAWRKHHELVQLEGPGRPERRVSQWRVLPSALLIAGLLALLSILAEFNPPYLYGLFAVYVGAHRFLKNLDEQERRKAEGLHTLIGMLGLTAVSVLAWFGWILLDRTFAQDSVGFGWLIADAILATAFLLGLEAVVFGMIPLAFLKGQEVWRWKPAMWAALFAPVAFFFVGVQLAVRKAGDLTSTEVIKAIALFVAFGIFSLMFWGYFHPRVRQRFSRIR